MNDALKNTEENPGLLKFPLAVFLRRDFIEAVRKKRNDESLFFSQLPETALMSVVGHMCAEEAFAASGRQPTVGDFIKLARNHVRKYPGMGIDRVRFLESYLAIFDLHFADKVEDEINLGEAEDKVLQLVQPKESEA